MLMGTSLFCFALLALLPLSGHTTATATKFLFALSGILVFLPWGLFCACMWFHPAHGRMQPGNGLIGRMPGIIQISVRWYSAIFLLVFILLSVVGLPLFVVFTSSTG